MGIEPTLLAWKASALPLSYTRTLLILRFVEFEPGGEDWIRTSEGTASRFTVCPL